MEYSMLRSFSSLGLVKHAAPHFSTARPTYETGSAKSVIEGTGEKQCPKNWKERSHSLRAARAALARQSLSVWRRTERAWPSHTRRTPARLPPWSKRLNRVVERLSRFKRTLPTLKL